MLSNLLTPAWVILIALVASYFVTRVIIPVVIRVSREKHLMDEPNNRSSHSQKTPSLGGVAIFAAIATVFTTSVNLLSQSTPVHFIVPPLVILFFIGLKDDILIIDPYKKLGAQLLAGTLLIMGGDIRLGNLYGLFGVYELPYIASFLLTLFVIIVTINAYNLIDGIDGLAGGLGIVVCITFGVYFYIANVLWATILSVSMIGALLSFIQFNFSHLNKVFMGDCGSLTVGFVLALLAIKFIQVNEVAGQIAYIENAPALAVAVLLIPLFDTLRVFIHRISSGKGPFHADRNHIHHFVIDSGFTHMQASILLCSVNAGIIGIGFFLFAQSSVWASFVFLGVLFLTYALVVRRKDAVPARKANKLSKYYVSKPVAVEKMQQEPVN